jgi:hypothetical protein
MNRRWSAAARIDFLVKLAATGDVAGAATAAGYSVKEALELRAEDKGFDGGWRRAEGIARPAIDPHAYPGRAVDSESDIIPGDGVVIDHHGQSLTIRRNSHAVLLAKLKAHGPENESERLERMAIEEENRASDLSCFELEARMKWALEQADLHRKRLLALEALRENEAEPVANCDDISASGCLKDRQRR